MRFMGITKFETNLGEKWPVDKTIPSSDLLLVSLKMRASKIKASLVENGIFFQFQTKRCCSEAAIFWAFPENL